MEVWPGGKAGAADCAELLALRDSGAHTNGAGNRLKVGIVRNISVIMLDDNKVTIIAVAMASSSVVLTCRIDLLHTAIGDGHDLAAFGRSDVNTAVTTQLFVNRMNALAEFRGYACFAWHGPK